MAKVFNEQFKIDAVKYYHEHKKLGLHACAIELGVSRQTLSRWQKELREASAAKVTDISANDSIEMREIARLKNELRCVIDENKHLKDMVQKSLDEISYLKKEIKNAEENVDILKKALNIINELLE